MIKERVFDWLSALTMIHVISVSKSFVIIKVSCHVNNKVLTKKHQENQLKNPQLVNVGLNGKLVKS